MTAGSVRVIPRLDIKGPNLVKGIHLEGLRVLGKPGAFARLYYEQGADELLYMDAVASLYGRNSLLAVVEQTAREMYIPLTVGGGIRTLDDIHAVLRVGADKVAINTAAIHDPTLITRAARRFGSSTVVVAIDAIRTPQGGYEPYTDYGRERTGLDVVEWATQVAELGAGEILLTSIDRDGTGRGYDLELTRQISDAVPIPVIACGGAGRPADVVEAVTVGHADAVCLGSMLHYNVVENVDMNPLAYADEGNTEFLRRRTQSSRRTDTSLVELKAYLLAHGVQCRPQGRIQTR